MSRVVVITGGGTGIGAACARLMAAAGETVFITGRRLAPLQALAEETGALALAAMPPAAMSGRLICCRRFSNARAISTF
ncbi:3-ketoacyl-ACP reductase [Raoultella ornithinolytica]|nr:3-ketoacyl-ACP reductase [Raoultella ornithinolytica]